ncbi:MAG: hypothetical protein LBK71_12300 [Verrucomicrobiales bacterium]|jgi:hypothetical protein|nr:hypothetical protein [Verrucomicrobiales bacterium]
MDTTVTIGIFIGQVILSGVIAYGTAAAFLARLDQRVKHLEDGNIRERLTACETSLKEREPLLRKKSPVSLTDRGQEFLKNSGSAKFVDENFGELLEKINGLTPKTAYDVQENARKVIELMRDDDRLNDIKEFLFKDGSSLDDAVSVMGIYLRDKVLKQKDWNVADIDSQQSTTA